MQAIVVKVLRDDLDKLPLPASAKRYARMKASDLGQNWSKKTDMYMDMAADLTNQSKEGFQNKDASGPVTHAFKESAVRVVGRLLGEDDEDLLRQMGDVANKPITLYKLAREAMNSLLREGNDMEIAIAAALEVVGIVGAKTHLGDSLPGYIYTALSDISNGGEPEDSLRYVSRGLDYAVPGLEPGSKWALMRVFTEEAESIKAASDEFEVEGGGRPDEWDHEGTDQETDIVVEESIKAAAVKCHDGTVIAGPPGADHIACCMMANQQGKSWDEEGLGFVTDDGRFVDRNEAEIEGMKHGQLKPEISDPGMVHARDFYWNDSRDGSGRYYYATNCVVGNGKDITDMVDTAVDVTYAEFMRNVPLDQIFASGIGYDYYWTPAQAILGGVDYHEVASNRPLTLKKDWHVTYHKSTYQGRPCYFMCHSAIEYVFVKY